MADVTQRRYAQDAGLSWRKWSDPLMYGPMAPPRRSRVGVLLFLGNCVLWGAFAALCVRGGLS